MTRWKLIGVLRLVVGIWLPATGAAAAIGVVGLMVGAVVARLQAGEGRSNGVMADVVVLALAVLAAVLSWSNV